MTIPTRGWGPWRQNWYSYHSNPKLQDPANGAGRWCNAWFQVADSWIYRHAKPVWVWWHNRENSATKRSLRRHFPNLK